MLLMAFVCSGSISMAQFTATMKNVVKGDERIYQVYHDGENYRYEFSEDGMDGVVIVKPAENKTSILVPEKKYVHHTTCHDVMSRMNDPVQSVMTIKDRYNEKGLGEEEIAGFKCSKSELFAADQKVFTLWFSEELNFPLRIENNFQRDTYMELSGINVQDVVANKFVVPEDYTEVDDKMRPKIPEPPPPDSWTNVELSLPVNRVFQRGEKIVVNINDETNYRLTAINNSESPAKFVRSVWKDGAELAEEKQGPLKYRTKRIFDGEKFSNVYHWKAGEQVRIEVHEGELQLVLDLEKPIN